jgi:multiple sugar transport system permease protein
MLRQQWIFVLFIAPFALTSLVFGVWPIAQSIKLAFTDSFTALSPDPKFVGLENFQSVLSDTAFANSLNVTLLYTALAVPLNVGLALLLSLFFSSENLARGRTMFKMILFLPVVCPEVASYVVLKYFFNLRFGVINTALANLNLPIFSGLTEPVSAFITVLAIEAWSHIGLFAIVFIANIALLDDSQEEAAKIDGANPLQVLWYIKLPQLRPAIIINTVYCLILYLKVFSVSYIVSHSGPQSVTNFVSYYSYLKFSAGNYGEATAAATILFVIVCVCSGLMYWFLQRGSQNDR